MPQIKPPRLYQNRHGVFYFRIKTRAYDRRISLRTKCPSTAAIIALDLNLAIERERVLKNPKLSDVLGALSPGKQKRYEVDLRTGVVKADGPEDHARAMEAIAKMAPLHHSIEIARPQSAGLKSLLLPEVVKLWLVECKLKNAERTVYAKERHLVDFTKRIGSNIEINAITTATIVGYKSALHTDEQKAKTIDNKLMTLHDLFKYALSHGYYTASNANPVSGLFIQTGSTREATTEPFEPYADEEIKRFFSADIYRKAMDMPDFFWAPLLGIYTGMRISEATALRVDDVLTAPNGLSYMHVRKSKTNAGKRNVPMCDALVNLGFLDYLNEVRSIGAQWIFPHRLVINGTRSKKLSEQMTAYLIQLGIRQSGKDKIRKSFHSFRVNVITALANAGSNTMQVMKIVGHKNEKGTKVHAGYVRELPDLKLEVEKLVWPIDLVPLKYDGGFMAVLNDKTKWDGHKRKSKNTGKKKAT